MITLNEHKSDSYGPRTFHNASQGITLAVAINFNTGGEKLTTKAAKGKIVHYDPTKEDYKVKGRELYNMLKEHDCRVVNVAGNGIYTWDKGGHNQHYVNREVYRILKLVHHNWKLDLVVSGGQSGADIAGLIAAEHLDIPSIGTWPKGFKMRFEDGMDIELSKKDVEELLGNYEGSLPWLNPVKLIGISEVTGDTYKWKRRGGYECSSIGDKRFSALHATMSDGRTLEMHYQCDVKGFNPGGENWREGKGKPPLDSSKDLWKEYLALWETWAKDHPDLMKELKEKVVEHDYYLSDVFATSDISQARALAELLNKGY